MKTLFERYLVEDYKLKDIYRDTLEIMDRVEAEMGYDKAWWSFKEIDKRSNSVTFKGNGNDRDVTLEILNEVIRRLEDKYGDAVKAYYWMDDRDDPYYNDAEYDNDLIYFTVKLI